MKPFIEHWLIEWCDTLGSNESAIVLLSPLITKMPLCDSGWHTPPWRIQCRVGREWPVRREAAPDRPEWTIELCSQCDCTMRPSVRPKKARHQRMRSLFTCMLDRLLVKAHMAARWARKPSRLGCGLGKSDRGYNYPVSALLVSIGVSLRSFLAFHPPVLKPNLYLPLSKV